jgi:hypothetical protein
MAGIGHRPAKSHAKGLILSCYFFFLYVVLSISIEIQGRGDEICRRICVGPPFSGELLQDFFMQRYASLSRCTLLVVSVLAASLLFSGKAHAQLVNGTFSDIDSLTVNNATGIIPSGSNSSTALPGWIATRSIFPDSNVYIYTTNPDANNPFFFFLNNPPAGFNFAVQLDSTTGNGTQEQFGPGQGASLSQALFLAPGTYQLSFLISTEVGAAQGVTKGGTSGILVSLLGPGITSGSLNSAEFLTTSPVPATRANTPWTPEAVDFTVGTPGTVTLTFEDDPNPALGNNLRSSNIGLADVSIAAIPEPAPLTLIGVGVVSLVGFQTLLKRRRA